eukprot:gnl/TRDRNA2_/TRDRNA2_183059_c0_seq1.p1 gnl/TRDRNA2_/TRDRNA2_183059_c0~~gnl/TRDRNA2_/TRDRNA2_183059_c0_seq1.p1  ORF type:complete len:503 (-),score=82.28 gnl/TRDRNA2_/TRDRNA2_183059_c0_seq1:63-1571(-)
MNALVLKPLRLSLSILHVSVALQSLVQSPLDPGVKGLESRHLEVEAEAVNTDSSCYEDCFNTLSLLQTKMTVKRTAPLGVATEGLAAHEINRAAPAQLDLLQIALGGEPEQMIAAQLQLADARSAGGEQLSQAGVRTSAAPTPRQSDDSEGIMLLLNQLGSLDSQTRLASRTQSGTLAVILLVVIPCAISCCLICVMYQLNRVGMDEGAPAKVQQKPFVMNERAVETLEASNLPSAQRLQSVAGLGNKQEPPRFQEPPREEPPAREPNFSNVSVNPGDSSGCLCPMLVVQKQGTALVFSTELNPGPQEEVVDIVNNEGRTLVLRAFVSETTMEGQGVRQNPGILIETTLRFPVAFIDTKPALAGLTLAPGGYVGIKRAVSDGWSKRLFAHVRQDPRSLNRFICRRGEPSAGGDSSEGELLLTVNWDISLRVANIIGKDDRLQATSEPHMNFAAKTSGVQAAGNQRLLKLAAGVDAALIVCAVLAVQKLQERRADHSQYGIKL